MLPAFANVDKVLMIKAWSWRMRQVTDKQMEYRSNGTDLWVGKEDWPPGCSPFNKNDATTDVTWRRKGLEDCPPLKKSQWAYEALPWSRRKVAGPCDLTHTLPSSPTGQTSGLEAEMIHFVKIGQRALAIFTNTIAVFNLAYIGICSERNKITLFVLSRTQTHVPFKTHDTPVLRFAGRHRKRLGCLPWCSAWSLAGKVMPIS